MRSSFIQRPLFIQSREDALRHVNQLATGLKKIALAGLAGGAGCSVMAMLLRSFLAPSSTQSNGTAGWRELSGILFVAWFMAIALLVFSSLYLLSGWGLAHQKAWARYAAAATFIAKVLLCLWLGRATVSAMIIFLFIAAWDFYGLWVLLAKETGQLFTSFATSQANIKPANLVS